MPNRLKQRPIPLVELSHTEQTTIWFQLDSVGVGSNWRLSGTLYSTWAFRRKPETLGRRSRVLPVRSREETELIVRPVGDKAAIGPLDHCHGRAAVIREPLEIHVRIACAEAQDGVSCGVELPVPDFHILQITPLLSSCISPLF